MIKKMIGLQYDHQRHHHRRRRQHQHQPRLHRVLCVEGGKGEGGGDMYVFGSFLIVAMTREIRLGECHNT